MSYYEFEESDILINTIRAMPEISFFVYSGSIYYNNRIKESGSFSDSVLMMTGAGIADGHPGVSLYEMNIDRSSDSVIGSFISKGGSRTAFKTISTSNFDDLNQFEMGSEITSSYPLTASISRDFFPAGSSRTRIKSLKNTIGYYTKNSSQFEYSSSIRDFDDCEVNLISVPSIFYGSRIEPGTIDLKFFVTGTLTARIQDSKRNGELVQTYLVSDSTATGSVQGLVLYKEGFLILTGAVDLTPNIDDYNGDSDSGPFQWIYFASTGSHNDGSYNGLPSSSFEINFKGNTYIPTLTMFAHAPRNELNHTENPTFLDYDLTSSRETSSTTFLAKGGSIKNIQDSIYPDPAADFVKQTYISKIIIYDEEKNVLGIAKLANPVRKREADSFTFKLKLDF